MTAVTYEGLASILESMSRATNNHEIRHTLTAGELQCRALIVTPLPTLRGKPVRNVATGMRYPNATEAAKVIGVTTAAMSQHLNAKLPHVKGQRFERIAE